MPLIAGSAEFDYANYWGATVALYLTALTGAAWDRAGGSSLGLSFRIDGPALTTFRFQVTTPDLDPTIEGSYCQEWSPSSGDTIEILFSELKTQCWPNGAGTYLPATDALSSLEWTIFAVANDPKVFDFCISDIRPLVAAR